MAGQQQQVADLTWVHVSMRVSDATATLAALGDSEYSLVDAVGVGADPQVRLDLVTDLCRQAEAASRAADRLERKLGQLQHQLMGEMAGLQ